ncbi:DUF302 domain-containing protein [Fischerella thermalis CCMEE 5273]|jgi:uncharacterized protein (DUF302 family)|uniref:DUF302 domain-containing protein n=1 Tax=Fischerella thermalis CCMEE 5268 TaxID=2019662 RepID=A0A2N6KLR0_9CYAN|nr:DUF302 domain-containing protein [Fischerella thermalis]PMB00803.1 DUF302 domain-containing protein [Fischerella thermalis CCMEE 5268]PMB05361.1 DUF302 domain-containing protein [Fischerella thermalis CCMEE 5273]
MEAVDVKVSDERVQTLNYTVTRVVVSSDKPFDEVINAIESIVGDGKYSVFEELVAAKAPFEQVKAVLESMLGSSGFMKMAMFDLGALLSLMGKPKNVKLYLLGNPLIANQMIEQNPAVGLYVPPRLLVYDDYDGKTHIAYDKPSSMLSQFDNGFILKVSQMLDQRFQEAATAIA